MIFLIQYERRAAKLVRIDCFADSERGMAERARLNLELSTLDSNIEQEIVLLQADSEAALHLTHGRYFQALNEIFVARSTEASPA